MTRQVKKTNQYGDWEVYTSENGYQWRQVLSDTEENCGILVLAYRYIGFEEVVDK